LGDSEVIGNQYSVHIVPNIGRRVLMLAEKGEDIIQNLVPRVIELSVEENSFGK